MSLWDGCSVLSFFAAFCLGGLGFLFQTPAVGWWGRDPVGNYHHHSLPRVAHHQCPAYWYQVGVFSVPEFCACHSGMAVLCCPSLQLFAWVVCLQFSLFYPGCQMVPICVMGSSPGHICDLTFTSVTF